MRIKSEYEPIVLVGAWNKAMFTPDWVQKYVFPGIPMNIEFPLNNPLASIRYSAKGIVFSTVESRISSFKRHLSSFTTYSDSEFWNQSRV